MARRPGLSRCLACWARPPAATLTALVNIDGFPTTGGEVLSMGNYLALRVSATDVRGFYYTGAAGSATIASVALGTTDWAHLAYTATAREPEALHQRHAGRLHHQRGAAGVDRADRRTNTIIGGHGGGLTTQRYQGIIDDARVYSRVLSPTDIAALALFDDTPTLALQILSPTAGASPVPVPTCSVPSAAPPAMMSG